MAGKHLSLSSGSARGEILRLAAKLGAVGLGRLVRIQARARPNLVRKSAKLGGRGDGEAVRRRNPKEEK